MNKFEYKLLEASSAGQLTEIVNHYLNLGYRLKGPPNVSRSSSNVSDYAIYIQAMTKEIKE